jgi:hypothetical protein
MYSNIPDQRIPLSKKNKDWQKNCIDAYCQLATTNYNDRKRRLKRLYDYYNGLIDMEDYDYVLRPYGKTRTNFPSKIRNYPLIKPTIDILLGEKEKRPFNYTVSVINSYAVDRKEKAKNDLILQTIQQSVVNAMNQVVETGEESNPVPDSKDLQDMFERSYVDNMAIAGQKGLTYIMQEQDVQEKMEKGFFHWLVAGEVYSERVVRNNEVEYNLINPLDIDYDLDPDLDYVEDSDWALITQYMGPAAIIRAWGRLLDKDQTNAVMTETSYDTNLLFFEDRREDHLQSRLIKVRKIYWQSMKRIGFLTYMDPMTGASETMEVPDGFTIPEEMKELGAKIEWEWHNQPWQAIRIHDDIDIDVRPVEEYPGSPDNPSKIKLPVNGRRYSNINSSNISLVMLGVPFQINYNIYKYRLETSIARSKDIIAQLDINLIPKKWDMDKFMYYVEGTGIAWVDYDKEGVKLSPQHQTVMDLSVKTIGLYIELLNQITMEWEMVSGVNKQRRGEVGQYQGKSMGQQAIVQSSYITEDLFKKYAYFEKRDLQAILDISKYAWINGKKGTILLPDGTVDYFTINPDEWRMADLGVFVTDATKEVEKLNAARELVQAFMQNGGQFSMALETLESDNFVELKQKIQQAEQAMMELQQAQSEAESQGLQAQREFEVQKHSDEMLSKERDRQVEQEEGERDRQNQIILKNMELNRPAPQPMADPREQGLKERQQSETERSNRAKEGLEEKKINASKQKNSDR